MKTRRYLVEAKPGVVIEEPCPNCGVRGAHYCVGQTERAYGELDETSIALCGVECPCPAPAWPDWGCAHA